MLVYTLPEWMAPEDFDAVADHIRSMPRRGAVVVADGVDVKYVPDGPTFRAKRGHTPRWTRRPVVRQA